jgi:hypothetical protein
MVAIKSLDFRKMNSTPSTFYTVWHLVLQQSPQQPVPKVSRSAIALTGGFAVTKALSEAGWHVRALTRDPTSQKNIEKFSGLDNVELVAFDIDDIATVRGAFQSVELVYLVTVPGPNSTKTRVNGKVPRGDSELNEEGQGKRVADVAKELGVNLVIQSTISMVDQSKYMDLEDITGKLAIEQYLKDIGQPAVHLSMGVSNLPKSPTVMLTRRCSTRTCLCQVHSSRMEMMKSSSRTRTELSRTRRDVSPSVYQG